MRILFLDRRFSTLALLLFLLLTRPPHLLAQPSVLAGLDAYIEQGMADWEIPGLSIAVVKDDEVVYARGFGVRQLGSPDRVDQHTLFGVASTTKAMTTAALGMLVDEGKLHWDDPVVRHIPSFRLSDPWVTVNVTPRDLLTHRVGVTRIVGNRLQYMTNRSRSEIVYRMRYHTFEQPFRQGFVYSNAMYMVAGELIPAIDGRSWDAFLRDRIFDPLGMRRSNTSVADIADGENAAWPHQEIDGVVQPIPRRSWDNVAASAALNTSAQEMAQWIRLHLGEPGVYEGRRLISEDVLREMYRPQIITSVDATGAIGSYGLGWTVGTYEGRRMLSHGGASDGMNTWLVLLPEENLGLVVMTNTFNRFMNALGNDVLDRYLGIGPRDWNRLHLENDQRVRTLAETRRHAIHAARVEGTQPSLSPGRYAGVYVDSLYDNARVTLENGRLVLQLFDDPGVTADLEHWHYDTFRAIWRNRGMREEFVTFALNQRGEVGTLSIEFVQRPLYLQVGAYPSDYSKAVTFARKE